MKKLLLLAIVALSHLSISATRVLVSPNTLNRRDTTVVLSSPSRQLARIAGQSQLGRELILPLDKTEQEFGIIYGTSLNVLDEQTGQELGTAEIAIIKMVQETLFGTATSVRARVNLFEPGFFEGTHGLKVAEYEQEFDINASEETDVLGIELTIFEDGLNEASLRANYVAVPLLIGAGGE